MSHAIDDKSDDATWTHNGVLVRDIDKWQSILGEESRHWVWGFLRLTTRETRERILRKILDTALRETGVARSQGKFFIDALKTEKVSYATVPNDLKRRVKFYVESNKKCSNYFEKKINTTDAAVSMYDVVYLLGKCYVDSQRNSNKQKRRNAKNDKVTVSE